MAQRGRDIFQKGKPLLLAAARFYRLFPMRVRVKLFEHYRVTPAGTIKTR